MSTNSNIEMISQCFYALNSFKRHRALAIIKKDEGKSSDVQFHDLKQYQYIDNLELGLRALQRALYEDKNKETPLTATVEELQEEQ